MSIMIRSGQYITEINLQFTNPTGVGGTGLGGTVDLSTFPNLTGTIASGNGITQLVGVSGAPILQTIRFENNNLTQPSLEAAVIDIYNNRDSITGSANKNINFNLTGASMGKINRMLRLTGVNRYKAELDKLNFNVSYDVNGETDQTWTGAGANNNFSTVQNWANGASPLDYDSLYFRGTARLSGFNDLPNDTQFIGIKFNAGAGAFNLSGNRFVLTFDGINNNSTNTQTIRNDILLSGNNRTINCAAGAINLLGDIGGSGSLIKTGTSSLTLSGNNSYTGDTFINNSTVFVRNNNPFGSGNVYIPNVGGLSNGIINIPITATPENTIINNNIFINGVIGPSVFNIVANKSATLNGTVNCSTAPQGLNVGNNATLTFNGEISGRSDWTTDLRLFGNGTYIVNSPIIFNNPTVNHVELNSNTVTLILSSTGNRFALRPIGGTVRTDVSFAINDNPLAIGATTADLTRIGRLNLNGTDQIVRNLLSSSTVVLAANTGTNIFNNSPTFSNLTVNNISNSSYVGSISGNINLIKSGTATLTVSGNMSSGVGLMYTGFTTITGGILSTRAPFSDLLGKINSGVFGTGASLIVNFATPPTNGESFRLLPGSTTNNYSIITLQGAAAGRTATYDRSNSTLTLTN